MPALCSRGDTVSVFRLKQKQFIPHLQDREKHKRPMESYLTTM